jgi:hypothetical protein
MTASTPVAEVGEARVGRFQLGAHRPVADHHTLGQSVQDVDVEAAFVSGSHATRIVGLCKWPQ